MGRVHLCTIARKRENNGQQKSKSTARQIRLYGYKMNRYQSSRIAETTACGGRKERRG